MIKFQTETGSLYEVDTETKLVLKTSDHYTGRQSTDWQPYESVTEVAVGLEVLFTWPEGTPLLPGSPPSALPATLTSRVVEVFEL